MASSTTPILKPLPPVFVHFLGTCSGGGPIVSRNCSSLAVDFGGEIWLFDAADATLQRLHQSSLRMSNITRIFVTHMHADHCLGIVAILTTIMSGVTMTAESTEALRKQGARKKANINIYGPRGLRELIRTTLRITSVTLAGAYAVHELLLKTEDPAVTCNESELHTNEAVGRDIRADDDGVWRDVIPIGAERNGKSWGVSAGPIEHRVPSLGYVLSEPTPLGALDTATLIPLLQSNAKALSELPTPIKHPLSILSKLTSYPSPAPITLPSGHILHPPSPSGIPPRKILIFGDCSGGTRNPAFKQMCMNPSLVIHECTNAHIPESVGKGEKGRKVRVNGLAPSLVKDFEEKIGDVIGSDQRDVSSPDGAINGRAEDDDEGEVWSWTEKDLENKVVVRKKAVGRGHSTPDEVADFVRSIKARRVAVNHFSAMFPCPRYPSSSPFPSLLSPVSPFPYPTPSPVTNSHDPPISTLPLFTSELHLRLIMQCIAEQITRIWTSKQSETDETEIDSSGIPHNDDSNDKKVPRLAVAARDFMVLPIPSHEVTDTEIQAVVEAKKEAREVMKSWVHHGGVEHNGVWLGGERERDP